MSIDDAINDRDDSIVENIGPFATEHYKVTVGGYQIPYTKLVKAGNVWNVILDGRFSITATDDEISRWMWLLANAMAIAAGYTCHGASCKPANLYQTKLIGLSMDEFNDLKGGEE